MEGKYKKLTIILQRGLIVAARLVTAVKFSCMSRCKILFRIGLKRD